MHSHATSRIALVLTAVIGIAPDAGAQRRGFVSTFGDSMKVTNGFTISRDGRTLLTSERDAVGKEGGRHVWRMYGPASARRLAATLYEYDVIDGAARNRRRMTIANDSLDYYPLLTHDDTRLLFNSRRPVPGVDTVASTDVHIWMTGRTPAGWGEPQYLSQVNVRGASSQYAQQLADTSLLFSSNRPGSIPGAEGRPSFDLWVSPWRRGAWQTPTPLSTLNSEGDEEAPFVHRLGRLMFFKRNRAGESHLYVTVLEGGTWRAPRQVYVTDLGGFDEHSPRVSADGRTFYFVNGLTIMHIPLRELLTPDELRIAGVGQ